MNKKFNQVGQIALKNISTTDIFYKTLLSYIDFDSHKDFTNQD